MVREAQATSVAGTRLARLPRGSRGALAQDTVAPTAVTEPRAWPVTLEPHLDSSRTGQPTEPPNRSPMTERRRTGRAWAGCTAEPVGIVSRRLAWLQARGFGRRLLLARKLQPSPFPSRASSSGLAATGGPRDLGRLVSARVERWEEAVDFSLHGRPRACSFGSTHGTPHRQLGVRSREHSPSAALARGLPRAGPTSVGFEANNHSRVGGREDSTPVKSRRVAPACRAHGLRRRRETSLWAGRASGRGTSWRD